jgi:aldehyde dehydrogenase (NAD+)
VGVGACGAARSGCAAYLAEGHILPADIPGKESRTYRKPVGVVGAISPWNWPLHLSMRSVAPALAVGNAVVLKPSSDTPVTGGTLVAKIFEEAGLPVELLSVVAGSGADIGDAFVKHATPRVISFTAVGRALRDSVPMRRSSSASSSSSAAIPRSWSSTMPTSSVRCKPRWRGGSFTRARSA